MKAIITVGIPCSGKSYWAERMCEANPNMREINRDDIRMELFQLDKYSDYQFSKANEKAVTEEVNNRLDLYAYDGYDVIISDTNLNTKHRMALVTDLTLLGYFVCYEPFEVSFEVAMGRNFDRTDKFIPIPAMERMWKNWLVFKDNHGEML